MRIVGMRKEFALNYSIDRCAKRQHSEAAQVRSLVVKMMVFTLLFVITTTGTWAQAPLPNAWSFREILSPSKTAYSPDGYYIALGGSGAIQVYNSANLTPVRGIKTNVSPLASLSFSPEGKTLLIAGNYPNGTGWVELWNVSTGKLGSSFQVAKGGVNAASFSPDGKTIAVAGSDGKNVLLNTIQASSHLVLNSLATKLSSINSVAYSPGGDSIAAGGAIGTQGATEVWKVQTKKLVTTLVSETPSVTQVMFSPDAQYFAAGGTMSTDQEVQVQLFNLPTGHFISYPSTAQEFVRLAFTPDSQTLITTGGIYVPNMTGGNWETQFESWSVPKRSLNLRVVQTYSSADSALSPDGTTLANSGVGYIRGDRYIVGNYGFLNTLDVPSLSPKIGAVTGSTGATGPYHTPGPAFGAPAFSPDGKTLLGGGLNAWDGTAAIWDSITGNWLGSVPNPNGTFGLAFAYAPNGKSYAVAYTGTIYIFSSKDNSQLSSFSTPSPSIYSMKYSPDGTMIVLGGLTASNQGFVTIWNVKSGLVAWTLKTSASAGVSDIDFSPDGKTLVSGGKISSTTQTVGVVELWKIATGSLESTLKTQCSSVLSTKFSPNGKLIAVAGVASSTSNTSPLEIWDAGKKTLTGTLPVAVGTSMIPSVTFTPNSSQLVAASAVGIQVFTVASKTLDGFIGDFASFVTLSKDGTKIAYETGYDGIVSGPYSVPKTYQISSVTLKPAIVNHGDTSTATVTLASPAPAGGVYVSLFSSDAFHLPVTPTLFIPAGQRTNSTILNTSDVYGPSYVISAANGSSVKVATLTVRSATVGLLTFSPYTIVGGTSTTGSVTIDEPAGPNGAVVSLSSSASYLIVPASVIIPAGKQTATFIATSTKVTTSGEAVIWASWNNSTIYTGVVVTPSSPNH